VSGRCGNGPGLGESNEPETNLSRYRNGSGRMSHSSLVSQALNPINDRYIKNSLKIQNDFIGQLL